MWRLTALLVAASLVSAPALADVPSAETVTDAARPDAGYDGGFYLAEPEGRFRLQVNGRVQFQLAFASDLRDPGTPSVAFSVHRARLAVKVKAFGRLGFKAQIGFGKGNVSVKDFFADVMLVEGWLHLRAGQYKKPFSRKTVTSSGKSAFVERPVADRRYSGSERDVGITLHNRLGKAKGLEYAVGFLNGTGSNEVPPLFDPMLVGRVGYRVGAVKGYDEVDPKASGELGLSVGGGALLDLDVDDADDGRTAAVVDWLVRYRGLSHIGAVYVGTVQDGAAFSDQAFDGVGLSLQAGYLLGGVVEPAFIWSRVFLPGADNDQQEFGGALNLYVFDHRLKWVTRGVVEIADDPSGASYDLEVVTLLQAGF